MSNRRFACVAIFALAALFLSSPVSAQVQLTSRAAELTIDGRLHTQYNTTSVAGEPATEFLIRRARLEVDVVVNDFVSGRMQPDFGEGSISLKDAYLRLTFSDAFRATLGQFKRPFDLFELTSSTQILVIERAGGVRGVDACAGVGGACSLSGLTEKLQYSDRDVGVMLDGADPSGRVHYAASVSNGTGQNVADDNGSKSFSGRVAVTPRSGITVAANAGLHDYADGATLANEYAAAFGGDIEIGDYDAGLHVQAGVLAGENWQVAAVPTFVTAQGIVTYKAALTSNRFAQAVEPVARVSWADPDGDVADDHGWLYTPGVVIHFSGRNKLALNIDVWTPAVGDTEWSLKVQSYLHF